MKSILLSALFLFIPKMAVSQISEKDKKIYLDSTFNEIIRINNNNYVIRRDSRSTNPNDPFYRIIRNYKLIQKTYKINDYYKSGVLQSEGMSSNKDVLCREGEFVDYYENGNKKSSAYFVHGVQKGKYSEWYENGNKKIEKTHIETNKEDSAISKIDQFWDINQVQKVIDGNGNYEESNKESYSAGNIKDGVKSGIWKGWIRNPKNKYTEEYEKGKLISGKIVDENKTETTYTALEKRAQPKNGSQHFYKYLKENINVPRKFDYLVHETFIEYVIDEDGKIIEPKIIKSMNAKLDEKAIKALLSYGDWIPAEQRGQKIKSKFSLPYSYFILDSK